MWGGRWGRGSGPLKAIFNLEFSTVHIESIKLIYISRRRKHNKRNGAWSRRVRCDVRLSLIVVVGQLLAAIFVFLEVGSHLLLQQQVGGRHLRQVHRVNNNGWTIGWPGIQLLKTIAAHCINVADPGCLSRIRIFYIPDTGSLIRIKEFKYFNPKNGF